MIRTKFFAAIAASAASIVLANAFAQVADDFEPKFDFDAEMSSMMDDTNLALDLDIADGIADVSAGIDKGYEVASVFESAITDEEGDILVPDTFAETEY